MNRKQAIQKAKEDMTSTWNKSGKPVCPFCHRILHFAKNLVVEEGHVFKEGEEYACRYCGNVYLFNPKPK